MVHKFLYRAAVDSLRRMSPAEFLRRYFPHVVDDLVVFGEDPIAAVEKIFQDYVEPPADPKDAVDVKLLVAQ